MLNILKKLRSRKLDIISIFSRYYHVFSICVLLVLSINYPGFILLVIIYVYLSWQQLTKKILFFAVIALLMIYYISEKPGPGNLKEKGVITDKIKTDYYYKYTILAQNKRFFWYGNDLFRIGDYVEIDGKIQDFREAAFKNGFDLRKFYRGHNIQGTIKGTVTSTDETHWFYQIHHYLYMSEVEDEYQKYLQLMLFDRNFFTTSEQSTLRHVGLWQLLQLSGLHIFILLQMLQYSLMHIFKKSKHGIYVEYVVFGVIFLVMPFQFFVHRSMILLVVKYINKRTTLKLDYLNIQTLSLSILIVTFPYYLKNQSLLIYILILYARSLYKTLLQHQNSFIRSCKYACMIQVLLLPFHTTLSPFLIISPLSIYVIQGIFILIVSIFFIPFLKPILMPLFEIISKYVFDMDSLKSLYFGQMHPYIIAVFFGLILMMSFVNYRRKIVIILTLVLCLLIPKMMHQFIEPQLYILNVGQGDSQVYMDSRCVIVHDSFNYVGSFLKSKGIQEIDYLILSHSDLDHIKESEDLIKSFNVKHLVLSPYDDYPLGHQNTIYPTLGQSIACGDATLTFLGPIKNYHQANDNSLVYHMTVYHHQILYTGDISVQVENDLIDQYSLKLKSDILKVPHHGSITSSSSKFIYYVNPRYAIISYALDNHYGMPNKEVIQRYVQHNIKLILTPIQPFSKFHFRRYRIILKEG